MAADIVIVGAGVAGLAAAYRLAPDHDVVLVDRDAIGGGTSSRASGVITTPVDYPDQPKWAETALEFFRELDGTGVFEWTDREFVRGVRPGDYQAAKRRAADSGVRLEDVDGYADVFVESAPYEHVLVWEGTGYIDAAAFLATMHRECAHRGVELRPDNAVEAISVDDGSVAGVETAFGEIEADHVVVSAGSATRALLADLVPLPLRKFTWNVAYLDAPLPAGYPMGGDATVGAYWRATRDGQLLVGTEHQFTDEPAQEAVVGDRIERIIRDVLPGLLRHVSADTNVIRYECCPMADTTTPDGRAVIDTPPDGPHGLVVAAGFHGAGVMAADSIGRAVRSLVVDEPTPFPLAPFALDRFNTRETDFRFVSLFGR